MKKLYAVIGLLSALCACEQKEEFPVLTMKLTSEDPSVMVAQDRKSASMTVLPAGATVAFGLETNMAELTAEAADAEWCHPVRSSDALSIKVDPSTFETPRSTIVKLLYRGATMGTIEVTQTAAASLTLEATTLELESRGQSREIGVSTNQSVWTVQADRKWLSVAKEGNKILLSAPMNTSGDTQTATVTVTAGEGENLKTATITVSQSDATMVFEYVIPAPGTELRLPLYGRLDCTVDWGDGTTEELETECTLSSGAVRHTYAEQGTYLVSVAGSVEALYSLNTLVPAKSRSCLTRIVKWGNLGLQSLENGLSDHPNLTSLGELEDGALADVTSFYWSFRSNPKLESIPANLFKGCTKAENFAFLFTSSKAISEIPVGLLDDCVSATNFSSAFAYLSFTEIPEGLFANCSKVTMMNSTFASALVETLPHDLFAGCPELTEAKSTLSSCKNLRSLPEGLFANNKKVKTFNSCFQNDALLESIPATLFDACAATEDFGGVFFGCKALTQVPEGLFDECVGATSFLRTFAGCSALENVPVSLFDNCRKVTNFEGTLRDCEKLVTESPYTIVEGQKVHLYEREEHPELFAKSTGKKTCFRKCTLMPDYERIAADFAGWL